MKFQFNTNNIDFPERVKGQFEERLERLKKFKTGVHVMEVRVDVSRDSHHKKGDVYRVEVNVDLPGRVVRSVEQGPDMLSALDIVAEKLERQARDIKDKIVTGRRRGQ